MRRLLPLVSLLLLAPAAPAAAQLPITPADVQPHLAELQAIADANGGNRSAGRPGEVATGQYIGRILQSSGWAVTYQPVRFPYWEERTPPVVHDLQPGRDVLTLRGSAAADLTARVQTMRRSGCRRGDTRGFRRGRIALVPAGSCSFGSAVDRFRRAGARAVLVRTPAGATGLLTATLFRTARIPVANVTTQAARRLGAVRAPIRIAVNAFSETRTATNVIGQRTGTKPREVVMAGGHLDSVPEGPGLNDNGSGIAALLAAAQKIEPGVTDTLRLAFWTAEEWGLHGSARYVKRLTRAERRGIGVYLNADMVGSPNHTFEVYDAHATVRRPLLRRLRGARTVDVYGSSDHTAFADAGIPVSGIYTGGPERKTAAEARRWGGTAGRLRDSCYHRACDTLANVNLDVTARSATVLAETLVAFAAR